MIRVLITRAEPSASQTAALLKNSGYEPVKFPLFEIQDVGTPIPDTQFDGYVFTSGNAIEVLAERGWKPQNQQVPVFCVGRKTALKANGLGFAEVVYEEGGAQKLAPVISHAKLPEQAKLLYFTTPDRSFDLKGTLEKEGLIVANLDIYKAAPLDPDASILRNIFLENPPRAVLCYSKRSAELLARQIRIAELENHLKNSTLIAISSQATGDLAAFEWNETRFPPVANERAILHILNEMS